MHGVITAHHTRARSQKGREEEEEKPEPHAELGDFCLCTLYTRTICLLSVYTDWSCVCASNGSLVVAFDLYIYIAFRYVSFGFCFFVFFRFIYLSVKKRRLVIA